MNTPGYPKFVAMMLAAYIDGKYYSLKGDIPAFNGFAELAPAAATTSVIPARLHFSKENLSSSNRVLLLGNRFDVQYINTRF